jgi:hypothetical protein
METTDKKVGHTPGPWRYDSREDEDNNDFEIHTPEFEKWVALVKSSQVGDSGEANARLIAAAPDLLEALEQVIRHGLIEQDGYETVLRQVHSAISKARG